MEIFRKNKKFSGQFFRLTSMCVCVNLKSKAFKGVTSAWHLTVYPRGHIVNCVCDEIMEELLLLKVRISARTLSASPIVLD